MTVVPLRITQALDAAGLFGPDVDRLLGGQEPMVDLWEAGRLQPTEHQLQRLCFLTGRPPWRFFQPLEPWEIGHVFVCSTGDAFDLPTDEQLKAW